MVSWYYDLHFMIVPLHSIQLLNEFIFYSPRNNIVLYCSIEQCFLKYAVPTPWGAWAGARVI